LGKSFSYAQYGNSIVNRAANFTEFKPISDESEFYVGGYLGPFDVSLLALVAVGLLASSLWEENYGGTKKDGDNNNNNEDAGDDDSKGEKSTAISALKGAFHATIRSADILSCGIISSLFEGSMYIFVFMVSRFDELVSSGQFLECFIIDD
jgi:hypothetical protein